MSEYKYTSDGKKVIVLGDLNKTEKIVQEIFIINNQEVPSGENFVVSSLHDSPAISWKEKKIKELEEKYKVESKDWEFKLENLKKRKSAAQREYESFINYWRKQVSEEELSETIDRIVKILSGKMTHLVIHTYSGYKIQKLEDALKTSESSIEHGLKMMTIYGRTNGKFNLRLHNYSDGSGGVYDVYAFESEQEAMFFVKKDVLKNIEEKKQVCDIHVQASEDFGFDIPKEMLSYYYGEKQKEYELYINKKQKEIEKLQNIADGFKIGEDRTRSK